MPRKNPPKGTDADLNLAELNELFTNEEAARQFLEKRRWPNGPVCPHCKSTYIRQLESRARSKYPTPRGTYKCNGCQTKFTVRIGTVFEDSRLPLSKWLMAFHLLSSSKKGISSCQIARELGITVKSAWFLTHRIREAMKAGPLAELLTGTVEADETYVGGKPRKGTGKHKRGRGTKKAPVMVLVQRDGGARSRPLDEVNMKTLKGEIGVNVAKEAVIMTDELNLYSGLGTHFAGHETVTHSKDEFVRKLESGLKVHTNTAESFFAILKRGHYGIYHRMSRRHLPRYCVEFDFRWNRRKMSDGERMVEAIKGAEGKRLMYHPPKNGEKVGALQLSRGEKEENELIDAMMF
jgi:transposase-like protein